MDLQARSSTEEHLLYTQKAEGSTPSAPMKICPKCGPLPTTEFHRNRSNPDGRQRVCKRCSCAARMAHYRAHTLEHREYTRQRRALVRKFLRAFLQVHPCVVCGEADPDVLEFDHLRDKSFDVSDAVKNGAGLERIEVEIAKCQVLCANCHRRKTRRSWREVSV